MRNPFRYFNSSPEVIHLAVMIGLASVYTNLRGFRLTQGIPKGAKL